MTGERLPSPGSWAHLAVRFWDVVTSRDLTPSEREFVREFLGKGPVLDAFEAQPRADQRHGYEAARLVQRARPDLPDLVRAAMLHDIGKRHSGLGPLGRVFASIAIRLGLPLRARFRLYRDHGLLAAAELTDEAPIVVEFARHHHGRRPPSITPADWDLLSRSDEPSFRGR